jgi:hypothetical protein
MLPGVGAASNAMLLPGVGAASGVPHAAARIAAPAAAAPGAFQAQPVAALPVALSRVPAGAFTGTFPGQSVTFPGVPVALPVAAALPGAAVPSSRAAPANRKRPASAFQHQTSSDEQGHELHCACSDAIGCSGQCSQLVHQTPSDELHCDVLDEAFFASVLLAEVRLHELRMRS